MLIIICSGFISLPGEFLKFLNIFSNIYNMHVVDIKIKKDTTLAHKKLSAEPDR